MNFTHNVRPEIQFYDVFLHVWLWVLNMSLVFALRGRLSASNSSSNKKRTFGARAICHDGPFGLLLAAQGAPVEHSQKGRGDSIHEMAGQKGGECVMYAWHRMCTRRPRLLVLQCRVDEWHDRKRLPSSWQEKPPANCSLCLDIA